MNAKQRDSLVALLREFVTLMEQNHYMSIILNKAEILGSPVGAWQSEVERLRMLPSRMEAQARTLRGLIDSLECAQDENSLTALIERMRQGKPN
jgi:hypothetical protein